ncbi:insulinase family protein [Streptomyces sp. NPDC012637]|uniref:M16 family metallopeptidase n=1 Tax=Streptomyces sp. NPDC012637 TaxID=3364842 RepID=UPI0036E99DDB
MTIPRPARAGGPHRRTLPNGLRVVVAPHWPTPRTAVAVHYGVGFRAERPGQEGMAHLFEHLMFRGSESLPDGAFYDALHPVAGAANGTTHQDYTDYFQTVPAGSLEQALFREADRMRAPRFVPDQLAAQLSEVAREIEQMRDGRPYGGLPWPLLPQVMFSRFASAHDGYGDARRLARVTVEDCADFFEAYYTPSNAVLTVLGPHPAEDVWPLVERHFGDVPGRTAAAAPPLDEPPLTEDRVLHRADPRVPRTAVAVGHRLPDPSVRPEAYVARMVLAELAQQTAAVEAGAPVSASCGFFGPLDVRGPDALVVTSVLPPDLTADAFLGRLTTFWARLGDARTVGESAADAARSLAARLHRDHADLQQRCRALGRTELLFGRPELVDELPDLVASVTPADLAEAAAELASAARAILVLGGEPEGMGPAATEGTGPATIEGKGPATAGAPAKPETAVGPEATAASEAAQGSETTAGPEAPVESVTPVESVAPVKSVTPVESIAPVESVTPVESVAPVGSMGSMGSVGDAPSGHGPQGRRGPEALARTSRGPRPLPSSGPAAGPRLDGAVETSADGGLRILAVPDRRAGQVEVRLRVPLGPDGWRRPAEAAWLLRHADAATGASARVRRLGGRLGLATGGQWADISAWAPREAYGELLRVVADLLAPPRFPDAFPASALAAAPRLSPEQRMDRALRLHWLGGATAEPLAPADLHARMLSPRDAVFVVVGDVDPERSAEQAAAALRPWPASAATPEPPSGTGTETGSGSGSGAASPTVLVLREPAAGDTVALTLCAPEPDGAPDLPARYLTTALFGGHYGARLAERCRRLGRAGHVMLAGRDVVAGRARALVRITAPRAEAARAVRDVAEEAAALAAAPPGRDELDTVRRYCAAQLLSAFDSPGLLADALRHTTGSGRGLDWVIGRPQLLDTVTGDEVAAAAAHLFVPATETVVALGNIEQGRLSDELTVSQ